MAACDSKLRRKRIQHLCSQLGCSVEDLLRDHRDVLSQRLVSQAQIMYRETHHHFYWRNKSEERK